MEYSFYIKGLKSLYEKDNPKVTLEKLIEMKNDGKITENEFAFITSEVTE